MPSTIGKRSALVPATQIGEMDRRDRLPARTREKLAGDGSGRVHELADHAREREALSQLYARHRRDPCVAERRRAWARLLTATLGTQFDDEDDDLFVRHTLLVSAAKIIAHAVAGLSPTRLGPAVLLSGRELAAQGIAGVVEPDCFDWLAAVPGGAAFLRALAGRLGDTAWTEVEHDVLKGLYESVITPGIRKRLGEYYTPDWLAEAIVARALGKPLTQRVLDPACGSGTFLFHAVRRYLAAAEAAGWSSARAIAGVTGQVLGIDLHPVAATLARVTYLLAIGPARLAQPGRGPVRVPVALADAMQWTPGIQAHESAIQERVDVLIGNPPWLAYRHMPRDMQRRFKAFAEVRGLWQGAKLATHQDLSALFAARTIQLYLRSGGGFAYVLPNAVVDRRQYAGFRGGRYDDPVEPVAVRFARPWDLRRLRPHLFPRGAAVVLGRRGKSSRSMPAEAEIWRGTIPAQVASWAALAGQLQRRTAALTLSDDVQPSAYEARFHQGATIVPRMLFLVERVDMGRRPPPGCARLRSSRSNHEKPPWRDLPALTGAVEVEFIRPIVLAEHVLPYRTTTLAEAVIPWDAGGPKLDQHAHLGKWWRRAASLWIRHRSSPRLSLAQQLDFHGKLAAQRPIAPLRVVYAKSGLHVCAAYVDDPGAYVDHSLYWCAVADVEEARYLCAILNAACVTERVRPYMSYGKDERDIHKHVWKLPIPGFDREDRRHLKLAKLAARMQTAIEALELDDDLYFPARRRQIRAFIAADPVGREIEAQVAALLGST